VLKIAFLDPSPIDYVVATPRVQPLGGSQSSLCYLAEELTKRGHVVALYNNTKTPGEFRGVKCFTITEAPLAWYAQYDAVVILNSGAPQIARQIRSAVGARTRILLWMQHNPDQPAAQPLADPASHDAWDGLVMVSGWQAEFYRQAFAVFPARMTIIGNAIGPVFENLCADTEALAAQKPWPPVLCYTSTPFRGLDVLLEAFPRIRAAIPGTTLKVYSSMSVYGVADSYDALYAQCRATEGVEYIGSLAQSSLAKALITTTCLAYPNTFAEGYCIAVHEAMAAGCIVITSDLGALRETTAGFAHLLALPSEKARHAERYAEFAVAVLEKFRSSPSEYAAWLQQQVRFVHQTETWAIRAREWEAWLTAMVAGAGTVTTAASDLFAAALQHHQAGRAQEAEALYRQILQGQPNHPDALHLLGVLAHQTGKHEMAVQYISRAIALKPAAAAYHSNLGEVYRALARLNEAAVSLRQALALQPASAEARNNLGAVLQAQGKLDEAIVQYQQAVAFKPDYAEAYNNLGTAFADEGKFDESVAQYQRAVALKPAYTEAYYNLGNALKAQGKLDEAVAQYQRAVALKPNYAEVYNNLGIALAEQGQLGEAIVHYQQALALRPAYAEAYNNWGLALQAQGNFEDSLAQFRQAIMHKSNYAEAYNNLGSALKAQGKQEEAVTQYRQAVAVRPAYPVAHNNLGVMLSEQGKQEEAVSHYRRALALQPACAEVYNNLGNALKAQGKLDEAVVQYWQALALKLDFAEAYNNLGIALMRRGQLGEAIVHYQQALALRPAYAEAYNNWGLALQEQGNFEGSLAQFRHALALKPDYADAHGNLLFTLNYHPDKSGEEIFAAYRAYDVRFGWPHRGHWRPHSNSRDATRRLKVGYVSPDFCRHSARHFLEPLLAHHDKGAVEVYAYADWAREDAVTAQYQGYVDHWLPTRGLPDDAMAERIRADGIDILVDLAGHTERHRLGVFARKPAPLSVSWLGYGYTTGLTAIDYFLTDAVCAPPGSEPLFAEVPWRLATPGYAYRPAEGMGDSHSLPALAKGFVTFGTLSRSVRINHRTIRVWAAILKRVGGARLVIDSRNFREVAMQTALAETFAAHGIGREQLEIGGHSPPWEVLRNMDIGLDCFPHNSGTTLFETLYLGVPFVTLQDRPSVGRLGSSILEGVGHPEWIARTEDEYVEIAVALAADLTKLSALRAGLRDEMKASPLMDEPAFARKVETAYREMWTRWCGSEA